jgi:hypothetical protein
MIIRTVMPALHHQQGRVYTNHIKPGTARLSRDPE